MQRQRKQHEAARHRLALRVLSPADVAHLPPCYLAAQRPGVVGGGGVGQLVQVDLRQGPEAVKAMVVAALGGASAFLRDALPCVSCRVGRGL